MILFAFVVTVFSILYTEGFGCIFVFTVQAYKHVMTENVKTHIECPGKELELCHMKLYQTSALWNNKSKILYWQNN
jgi:hypothetical protein